MSFLRTQCYSGDKASGGHIDFKKGSAITVEVNATESKKSDRVKKPEKQTEFKPKELFCDRDLEYTAENLTSATAIVSAFSEEDVAYLEELENKRNKRWKKRRQEEEEFAKEAYRLRSQSEEQDKAEVSKADSNEVKAGPAKGLLFCKSRSSTYTVKPIIVPKRKGIETKETVASFIQRSSDDPTDNTAKVNRNQEARSVPLQTATKGTSTVICTLIDGYSSNEED